MIQQHIPLSQPSRLSSGTLFLLLRLEHFAGEWRELQAQTSVTTLEGPIAGISLLNDHRQQPPGMACTVRSKLTQHTDEVWDVQFSHRGKCLDLLGAPGWGLVVRVQMRARVHAEGNQ
jgi:hypothetical protein